LAKNAVTVILGKEAAGKGGGGEEAGLSGKVGQAHKEARKCIAL
jgi:hypothetical protein